MNFSYTIKETCNKNSLIYKIFIENKKKFKTRNISIIKKKREKCYIT